MRISQVLALTAALGLTAALFVSAPEAASAQTPAAKQADPADDGDAKSDASLLETGIEQIVTGQYAAARRSGQKLAEQGGAHVVNGLWLQARAERESGDARVAVKLLEASLDKSTLLQTEYAWLLLQTGRYADAEKAARALLAAGKPDSHVMMHANAVIADALYWQGKHDDVAAVATASSTAGAIDVAEDAKQNYFLADAIWASGWAAYRNNDLHLAQTRWQASRRAFARHAPSWVGLGRIFFESNKDESARTDYCEEVYGSLKATGFNPNYSDAHLVAAYTYWFKWNARAGAASMQKALKLNPCNVEALAAYAAENISKDKYDEGKALYERALAVNPNSQYALGAKGLHFATLGKKDEFAALEADVLKVSPAPGEFYQVVADGLAGRHRFTEAIALYRKGIEKQPRLWTLHRELGRSLLNDGQSALGEESLRKAHKYDLLRNSVFTYNLLELLSTYKYFKRFEFGDGQFSVLVYEEEADIVAPYYEKELLAAQKELGAKYGFQPAKPLTIEAFHRHKDFEVRTVGIEGLPALGACFGKLITLDSPSARDPGTYNWAGTLRHELDHVYQLQMSNGQIPRWLAEGCSVYEERRARPEWERHSEDQLFQIYAANGLPKVKDFNTWFSDGSRVLFAYYLGSIMVEFIIHEYGGYQPIVTMIREFAAKKTPDEVFRDTLKIDTDEFDRKFRAHVGKKVSKIKLMPAVEVEQVAELQIKAEDGEASVTELVTLARALTQSGKVADARLWASLAQKRGAHTKELSYTLGLLAQSDTKLSDAKKAETSAKYFRQALDQGLEDFGLYMQLAQIARSQNKPEEMILMLERARDAFPTNAAPLQALYAHYSQTGDQTMALLTAEQIALLSEDNIQIRDWLLAEYLRLGDHAAAADMALQIIYVTPFPPAPHRKRAESLHEIKQFDDAIFEWEMFKRTTAAIKDEGAKSNDSIRRDGRLTAAIGKARAYIAAGRMREAATAVLDAQAESKTEQRVLDLVAEYEAAKSAAK